MALLMMEAARESLGFAARFVSGYLYDPALDGRGGDGGRRRRHPMPGSASTFPGAGWIEFDPTNGLIGGPQPDPRRRRARP